MRTFVRFTLVVTVIATLGLTLAGPAVAGQRTSYRGRTAQDERVRISVLKRDSGRRFLQDMIVFTTLTCEDASTETFGFGFRLHKRLGDEGSFTVHQGGAGAFGYAIDIEGIVRWVSAEGTVSVTVPGLTEEGQAQLCTTGVVDWSADRESSRPTRPVRSPDNVTFLEIDRDGDLQVIDA